MAKKEAAGGCVFPLTGLQIGDLQSYLSHLNLFLAPESDKIYILVDNHPWLKDLGLRSAHLWQLMVIKSRLSPFANSKARKKGKNDEEINKMMSSRTTKRNKMEKFRRWFFVIDAASFSQRRALLPVKNLRKTLLLNSKLHRTLYGFIVFEVAWTDVRGINYLNELQTDTSLALETKFMRRWEFDSIAQAASCLSLWFTGTHYDQLLMKDYLDSVAGEVFYDAEGDLSTHDSVNDNNETFFESDVSEKDRSPTFPNQFSSSFPVCPAIMENDVGSPHTPLLRGPYKRRKVINSRNSGIEIDKYSEETSGCIVDPQENIDNSYTSDYNLQVEATEYRDVLILFRFNDHDLPFKLRQIIMSDLRLLTLLESGLPSWVIFLQSYPVFCHLYRPWMCPLARALYVLISIVTVLIGFYDLYKNVPVLKETAYGICGPLLDWIETWEMVSRIKYLGTMLFLQNFKKAVKCILTFYHATRSFFLVLAQPMSGPLLELLNYILPFWNMCDDVAESLCSVIGIIIGSSFSLFEVLAATLLQPVWYTFSFIWSVATSVIFPLFWILWEVLYAPVRLVLSFFTFVAFIFTYISECLGEIWYSISSIYQLNTASEVALSTYEISIWSSLWNDLFSQIFRAIRSILNGFVAFFTACNRHRLSIYNHILEFIQRLSGQRSHPSELKDSKQDFRTQISARNACIYTDARW